MDTTELYGLLGLAFGLGWLHALDADHIAAVSGLASTRATFRDTLRFCLRWSLGHGLTLLLIGTAVLLLGMAIPERLSQLAEQAVGVVLIVIGVYVLWDVLRSDTHVHFHVHDDLSRHAHWHRHTEPAHAHRHHHGALMVGMVHGTAGSAPLLALLPLSAQAHPLFGIAYLVLFGLGVLLSMLVFGGLLGTVLRSLARRGASALRGVRLAVGLSSLGFGAWWVHGAF